MIHSKSRGAFRTFFSPCSLRFKSGLASISLFEMFSIGIGPSSSHTIGPMRAASHWARSLKNRLDEIDKVDVTLYGSLSATGEGHATPHALCLGLLGYLPAEVDPKATREEVARVWSDSRLKLLQTKEVTFGRSNIIWSKEELKFHSNGMRFCAKGQSDNVINESVFFSIGGGFFVDENGMKTDDALALVGGREERKQGNIKYPFETAAQLLEICQKNNLSIAQVAMENEKTWTPEHEIKPKLLKIWEVMHDSIQRGLHTEGVLPGKLNVVRRAASMRAKLEKRKRSATPFDWMSAYAIAVNEENAAGSRVVTAPTNGAAGIIPAVIKYMLDTGDDVTEDDICEFLAVAGVIGMLFKHGASISAAEVGCQGEVGVACSMAAGALCHVQKGTMEQVEDAAEIGMEHNLGLSCDPVGGLVQIPCIERNVMGAAKAVTSARLALLESGKGLVSLDDVIRTMLETGQEMKTAYKETSRAGLAKQTRISSAVTEC